MWTLGPRIKSPETKEPLSVVASPESLQRLRLSEAASAFIAGCPLLTCQGRSFFSPRLDSPPGPTALDSHQSCSYLSEANSKHLKIYLRCSVCKQLSKRLLHSLYFSGGEAGVNSSGVCQSTPRTFHGSHLSSQDDCWPRSKDFHSLSNFQAAQWL